MADLSSLLFLLHCSFLIRHGFGSKAPRLIQSPFNISQSRTVKSDSKENYPAYTSMLQAAFRRKPLALESSFRVVKPVVSDVVAPPYECKHIATEFVYRENLCGAPDPQSYLELYTCADRCGRAPVYGKSLAECGCDQKCVTYGDCCRDMDIVCPDLYEEGERVQKMQLNGTYTDCFYTLYKVLSVHVSENAKTESTPIPSTFPTVLYPAAEAETVNEGENERLLPYQTLNVYFDGFVQFRVADSVLGLPFLDYKTFMLYTPETRTPYFVPKISTFQCLSKTLKGNGQDSVLKVFKLCGDFGVEDARTSLHRSCSRDQILSCRGGANCGNFFMEHVHNACLGTNESQPAISKLPINPNALHHMLNPTHTCKLYPIGTAGVGNERSNPSITGDQSVMKMRLTIVNLFPNKSQLRERVHVRRLSTEDHSSKTNGNEMKFGFLLESSQTLEKRLWCPSINSFPTDCKVEECVHGAILTSNPFPQSQDTFTGQRCLQPVMMLASSTDPSLPVSLCVCMRILAAVTRMGIWTVTLAPGFQQSLQCAFFLTVKRRDQEDLTFVDDLFKTITPPSWIFADTPYLPKRPSFLDELERDVGRSTATCSENTPDELQICFHSRKKFVEHGKNDFYCTSLCLHSGNCRNGFRGEGAYRNQSSHLTFKTLVVLSLYLTSFCVTLVTIFH